MCAQLDSIFYHGTNIKAFINPSPKRADNFHVPTPGYNPMTHEDSHECTECEEPHTIIPEGFYVPPANTELFENLRGREVHIRIWQPNENE